MAVTKAEYTTYLPAIKITANGSDRTIPIWNLTLTVIPWSGGVGPAQKMADGRIRQKVRGWHVVVDMDMEFSVINTEDNCLATSAIQDMYIAGSGVIDFDPIDNPGDRVLTLVMKEGDEMSTAQFTGKIRGRRFRVTMITESVIATGAIPAWIAGDGTP